MKANDRQVGGEHYKLIYQHWDFVYDVRLPYHLACATKYVARWRDKNGTQDLEKAVHYVDKSKELGIGPSVIDGAPKRFTYIFIDQLPKAEADIIWEICSARYDIARKLLIGLIDEAQAEAEIVEARKRDGV